MRRLVIFLGFIWGTGAIATPDKCSMCDSKVISSMNAYQMQIVSLEEVCTMIEEKNVLCESRTP